MYIVTVVSLDDAHIPSLEEQDIAPTHAEAVEKALKFAQRLAREAGEEFNSPQIREELENDGTYHGDGWSVFVGLPG